MSKYLESAQESVNNYLATTGEEPKLLVMSKLTLHEIVHPLDTNRLAMLMGIEVKIDDTLKEGIVYSFPSTGDNS